MLILKSKLKGSIYRFCFIKQSTFLFLGVENSEENVTLNKKILINLSITYKKF